MAKFNGEYRANAITKELINSHVTLEEVKRNLRFDDPTIAHDDDDQIQMLIEAATEAAEGYTGRAIAKAEYMLHAFNFSGQSIKINIAPYISIKKIEVSSDNGVTFTTITNYVVQTGQSYFDIYFDSSISYDEIKIYFYAGYTTGKLPNRLRQFIIVEAADGYDTERSKFNYNVNLSDFQKRALGQFIINQY